MKFRQRNGEFFWEENDRQNVVSPMVGLGGPGGGGEGAGVRTIPLRPSMSSRFLQGVMRTVLQGGVLSKVLWGVLQGFPHRSGCTCFMGKTPARHDHRNSIEQWLAVGGWRLAVGRRWHSAHAG